MIFFHFVLSSFVTAVSASFTRQAGFLNEAPQRTQCSLGGKGRKVMDFLDWLQAVATVITTVQVQIWEQGMRVFHWNNNQKQSQCRIMKKWNNNNNKQSFLEWTTKNERNQINVHAKVYYIIAHLDCILIILIDMKLQLNF